MTAFIIFLLLCLMVEVTVMLGMNNQTNNELRGISTIMGDINERLKGIETRINEASEEILALIKKLQDEQLTDEGRKALDAIEKKANALADIVGEEPPPTP